MKFEIPEGFNYLAWDEDGYCHAYKEKPFISKLNTSSEYWTTLGDLVDSYVYNHQCPGNWDETIISREEQDAMNIAYPSISQFPEGYNWFAIDEDGHAYFYQTKPLQGTMDSVWVGTDWQRAYEFDLPSCMTPYKYWDQTLYGKGESYLKEDKEEQINHQRKEQESTKVIFPSASMFPDGYHWFAYDKSGAAFYYKELPYASKTGECWGGSKWLRADDFDLPINMTPYYAWENSLIGKQEEYQNNVNHPDHYTWVPGIECQQVVQHFSFNLGNVIKYVWRVANPEASKYASVEKRIEDLEKAKKYLDFEIERLRCQ